MQYLLDTNILLWHATADKRLPEDYQRILGSFTNEFFVSITSLWEITIKASRGDFVLVDDVGIFIKHRIEEVGFYILPICAEHLITLQHLPFHHKDPFDRLIIAQGLAENLHVLYTDRAFEAYFSQERQKIRP